MRKWTREKVLEEIKEFHNKLGHRPTKYEVGSLYNTSRRFFGTWGNALRVLGYDNVRQFQTVKIPQDLTNELAYFIGIVLSDGHVVFDERHQRYAVKLYTSYEVERDLLVRLTEALFDYNPFVRTRKYGFNKLPNYEIIISSRDLAEFLIQKFQIPYGKKSHKIRIPKIFFDGNLFLDLLRGIIDGDGGIDVSGVKIYSSSKEFLVDIKNILLSKFRIRTWGVNKSTNTVWYLTVPTIESLKLHVKLYKKCKFYYPKIKDKWDENLLIYDKQSIQLPPPVAQTGLNLE